MQPTTNKITDCTKTGMLLDDVLLVMMGVVLVEVSVVVVSLLVCDEVVCDEETGYEFSQKPISQEDRIVLRRDDTVLLRKADNVRCELGLSKGKQW